MATLDRLGRYRIVRLLGEGAMGSVYLAEDPALNRKVALKVPKFAASATQARERFFREARCAAALRHQNLCPVFDVGECEGLDYIALAFIEGRPLAEILGERGRFTPAAACWVVKQIADGMQYAHANGVIHRDLKPANVMIDESGTPVVTDFGISRRLGDEDVRLTNADSLMGSPAYMPPEHIETDETLSRGHVKSDIYSLGVIFYELLTGRLPFKGRTRHEIFKEILQGDVTRPSKICKDVDAVTESICLRMIARNPRRRIGSMREVCDVLTASFEPEAISPTQPPSAHLPFVEVTDSPDETKLVGFNHYDTRGDTKPSNIGTLIPADSTVPPTDGAMTSGATSTPANGESCLTTGKSYADVTDGNTGGGISASTRWRTGNESATARSYGVLVIATTVVLSLGLALPFFISTANTARDSNLGKDSGVATKESRSENLRADVHSSGNNSSHGKADRRASESNESNSETRLNSHGASSPSLATVSQSDGSSAVAGAANNREGRVDTSNAGDLDELHQSSGQAVAADQGSTVGSAKKLAKIDAAGSNASNSVQRSSRWLLTIGISEYPGADHQRDDSLNADLQEFERLLQHKAGFKSLGRLIDENATCENIRKALTSIQHKTEIGDSIVIIFRGDICDVPDNNSDENGGMDEVLIPVDGVVRELGKLLRDDDILEMCRQLTNRQLLLLLDVRERVVATSPQALLKKDVLLVNEFAELKSPSCNALVSVFTPRVTANGAMPVRLTRRLCRVLNSVQPHDFGSLIELASRDVAGTTVLGTPCSMRLSMDLQAVSTRLNQASE